MASDGERCETCRFWRENMFNETAIEAGDRDPDEPGIGECLRHAPPPRLTYDDEGGRLNVIWADTASDDWCGEYQPRTPLPVVG